MSKKLISLVLVLALASLASAVQWGGATFTDAAGDWQAPTNWVGGVLPAASDATCQIYTSTGTGSNVYLNSYEPGSIKPQMKFGNTKLEVQNGGTMYADGSFEQGTSGSSGSSIVIIDAGGLVDVCKKTTQTTGTWKVGSASPSTTTHLVDIYGVARVKGQLATSDIQVGYSGGTAEVRIEAGGLLDVDAYSIGVGKGVIKIYGQNAGSGIMQILGDKTSQVATDVAAGRIVCVDDGITWIYSGGYTKVWNLPEPATVALLGLGSLLLYRKKH